KTELDFRNRLIAKFEIPRAQHFWGSGFERIPESALYPKHDAILELCNELKNELREELSPGELGAFIKDWAELESNLLDEARTATSRNVSIREAIRFLAKTGILSSEQAQQLEGLRVFRNAVVHKPGTVKPGALEEWQMLSRHLVKTLVRSKP